MQVSLQETAICAEPSTWPAGWNLIRDVAEPQFLAIGDGLRAAGEIVAVAQPHHVERLLGGEHRAMAGPGVIGMAMGDHGALDRPYRIDVEVARLAAQPGGNRHQDVLWTHLRYIGRRGGSFENLPLSSLIPNPLEPVPRCPRACSCPQAIMIADRRFDFARDLQLKGDLVAAADLLLQAIDLAPGFASAWFTLGEIREQLGDREAAIAAFRKAQSRRSRRPPWRRLRLMLLGAEQLSAMPPAYVRALFDQYAPKFEAALGRRSRLSRTGAVVQGGAVGARRGPQAGLLQARDRSRLRHRACGDRLRQGGRRIHRHRSVAAHDRAGARRPVFMRSSR